MAEHVLDRQSTHLYQVRKKVLEMMRDLDYVVADNELTLTNEQFCEKYREDPKQEDLMILKPKSSNNAEHVMVFHEFFSPFPTLLSFCCAAHDVAAGVECLASRFLCSLPKGPKTGGKGRVGLKTIKTCKKRMKRENVPRAVFVVQQHITPLSKQYISRKAQKYHLEVFLVSPVTYSGNVIQSLVHILMLFWRPVLILVRTTIEMRGLFAQEPEFLVNITECYLVPLHEILTPEEKNTLLERYTEGNAVMLVLVIICNWFNMVF